MERTSNKMVVEHLLERGFRSYMGEMISKEIHHEREAREANEKLVKSVFVRELIRFAKARGMNISPFF